MRRVVTALVLIVAAGSLVACGGGTDTATTGTPVPAASPVPVTPAVAQAPSGDILSPTETVSPTEMFPSDPVSVPQTIIDKLAAKRPFIVYWYDPTTRAGSDQRREISAVMKKYKDDIALVGFDFTLGLTQGASGAILPPEVDKAARMTGSLRIDTTPYVMFVDAYGRITYRFSGIADRKLLEREVLRATR